SEERPTLIYIGDPMCSWCYGIAPELDALKDELKEEVNYEIIMGGLRPYNTQTMVELKEFLTHHWEEVHKRSSQEFNYEILDKPMLTYDTEPPSRAVAIVRAMNPSLAFEFFHACQTMFYKENKNMHRVDTYKEHVKALGLDFETFSTLFESEEWAKKIKEDFQRSAKIGVRSFPTVLLKHNGQVNIIAQGYRTKAQMQKTIQTILQ
ncbi:MAG: DsbA family protein, partial [Bacteroidota bacterium]